MTAGAVDVCLSDDTILDAVQGRGALGADAFAHLGRCSDCRRLLAAVVRGAAGDVPAAAPPSLEASTIVAGRYRLVGLIGEGGMGAVWEGRQITTDKAVAIKFLKRCDETDAARLLREARVAASLTHRNIVQVFDFGAVEDGSVFMVMELLVGETLAASIARQGRMTAAQTVGVLAPVASALRAAHAQGVVHRDLKPENIFLAHRASDETPEVKVIDFGLAKPLPSHAEVTAITQSGAVMGTPYYMAPEQVYGEKDVDPRADVWALGAVFYECLAGAKPFEGDNLGQVFRAISKAETRPLREVAPDVPSRLEALVTRMLSHDRERRPPMTEVYAVLQQSPGFHATLAFAGQAPAPFATARLPVPAQPSAPVADGPVASSLTVPSTTVPVSVARKDRTPRLGLRGATMLGGLLLVAIGAAAAVMTIPFARHPGLVADPAPAPSTAPPASASALVGVAPAAPRETEHSQAAGPPLPVPSSGATSVPAPPRPPSPKRVAPPRGMGTSDPLGRGRF